VAIGYKRATFEVGTPVVILRANGEIGEMLEVNGALGAVSIRHIVVAAADGDKERVLDPISLVDENQIVVGPQREQDTGQVSDCEIVFRPGLVDDEPFED
jgi:hypothetical protein